MGAHRTSLREDAVVVGGVLALDIIDGNGDVQHIERDESNDDWLAASTSLGLLGIIARIKMQIFPETKVYAMQTTLVTSPILHNNRCSLVQANISFFTVSMKGTFSTGTFTNSSRHI